MAHRHLVRRWCARHAGRLAGPAAEGRRDRPGLRGRYERIAATHRARKPSRIPGRRTQPPGRPSSRHSKRSAATVTIMGLASATAGARGLARPRSHPHLHRSGGRAHLLPRRAADAVGAEEGRHQAALGRRGAADRVAAAQRRRAAQPRGAGRPARLRQLPLLLRRRQDAWAWTWTARRTTRACTPWPRSRRELPIRNEDVIQWSSPEGRLKGDIRVGFMSQVSPDGRYVVTTVNPAAMDGRTRRAAQQLLRRQLQGLPLPAGVLSDARHPGLVQPRRPACCSPCPAPTIRATCRRTRVWSPDGKYLVFARAAAQDPNPPGAPLAQFANDPNELQIQIRPLPHSLQRRQGRRGRSPSPALRTTA